MPRKLKPGEEKCEKIYIKGKQTPALHISRSIGDVVAHTIGVLSEPGMEIYILTIFRRDYQLA